MSDEELLRCRECHTIFEAGVADRHPSGEPRCPQCFLSVFDPALTFDEGEPVIRTTTPFR